MVLTSLYGLNVACIHAHNEMMDGVLEALLPDLDQGITELLDS